MESNFQFDLQLLAEDDNDVDEIDDEQFAQLLEEDPDLALDPDVEDEDEDEDDIDLDDEDDEDAKAKKKNKARHLRPVDDPIDAETRQTIEDIKAGKYTQKPVETIQPVQPAQPRQELDINKAAEEFASDLLTDPKKAAAKFLATTIKMQRDTEARVRDEVRREFEPASRQAAEGVINSAMKEFDSHPQMTPEVRQEFENLVETAKKNYGAAFAKMPPSEIKKGLRAAFAEAIGNAALNSTERKPKKNATAPRYNVGGGRSRPARRAPSLTQDERSIIRNLRAAGLTSKDIKQAIRELREEQAS